MIFFCMAWFKHHLSIFCLGCMLGYLNLKFHSGQLVIEGQWNPERGEFDRVQLKTDPVESLVRKPIMFGCLCQFFGGVVCTRVYCIP